MSASGRVSIVVNNFNYAAFLSSAIDSALAQTYPDIEVIVVDDGSTDDSRAVIASYGDRITPVLKENGGQASACNAGFAASHGEIVIFLDSDDLLLSTAAETAMEQLRDHRVVKAHWQSWEIDGVGRDLNRLRPEQPLAQGDFRDEVIRSGQTRDEHASTSANAWRRTFLEQVLPIRDAGDRHGADEYLNTLAPLFGRISVVREPQGCYRVHERNFAAHLSLRGRFERYMRRYDLLRHVLQECLARQNTLVDLDAWKSADTYYGWCEDMLKASDEISTVIPAGTSFILVDDNQLGSDFVEGRCGLPFLQRDGRYAGHPADDDNAVSELERMRLDGAGFIVFIRTTHWWLDHYAGLHAYLRSTSTCVRDNERLVIFDLRGGGRAETSAFGNGLGGA